MLNLKLFLRRPTAENSEGREKSEYQILLEISEIWNELIDKK